MEKKNNGILIGIIIVLVIALLGLSFYIAYDKGLIFNNDVEEKEETEEEFLAESVIPTDMVLVSSELNELALDEVIELHYNDLSNGVNLLDDSSRKLNLLNAYFMKNNLVTWTNHLAPQGSQDFPYVSLETYKVKYEEVYGSLDKFEADTTSASGASYNLADSYDSSLSGNVCWNGTWGVSDFDLELEATKVTYNENNNYTIEGKIISNDDNNNVENKGTFKVLYVNDGNNKYITSVTIAK